MDYGLYVSAAGMKAQLARQDVVANNLANAQTTGFKRDLTLMQSRANAVNEDPTMFQYRAPVLEDMGGGMYASGAGIDLSQSLLESTGNQTDLALDGKGFFTVQGDNGQKLLTRDGRFLLDNQGNLVTATGGRKVLDANGQPITLNPDLPVVVGSDGMVTQDDAGGSGVQLGLANVSDSRKLVKLGGNVMAASNSDDLANAPSETKVLQGHLEASGTDPVVELVNMMEGQRAFDANAKMISYQDTTLSQVNTIGRVA